MTFKKRLTTNTLLALSIGFIYLWFGGLKFFSGWSPAEELAQDTIYQLSFHFIPSHVSIILLAIWETLIGVLLVLNVFRRFAVIVALIHMGFTFTPLVLFPDAVFGDSLINLTLVGQYIIKNLIIVSALLKLLPLPTRLSYRQWTILK